MSKNILFWPDVYLEQGHWLPTVVWADGLREAGHTAQYMGIRDCAAVVQPFGYLEANSLDQGRFTVIFDDLYPLGYTRSLLQETPNQRWKPDHLLAIAGGALDSLFTGPQKPDLLVSGYFAATESLMLQAKYGVPFVLTTTYLRHPQEGPEIRALKNLLGLQPAVARMLMQSVMGSSWNPNMEVQDFTKLLQTTEELVPCPQSFDFPHYQHGPNVHYLEPCITPDEPSARENDFWNQIPTDKKLIYATAGSQVQDYQALAENLFAELINMMNSPQMEGFHLILGAGPELAKKSWGSSTRYTVAAWAPQRSILAHPATRMAVIHGGLATTKECIHFDKPFVVVPLGKDQLDNGLRVRQAGIGRVLPAEKVDSDSLLLAITRTISDVWMSSRRASLSEVFHAQETLKPGLALLLSKLAD